MRGTCPKHSCLQVIILLADLADALHALAVFTTFGAFDGLVLQQTIDGLAG